MPRVVSAVLALWCLALWGCAVGEVGEVRPTIEAEACYESFHAAAEGWELFVGQLPVECQQLNERYEVVISDEMPCTGDVAGTVVGCHGPGWYITVRSGMSETKKVDISVHEWMHALSYCVYGDGDNLHKDPRVWGDRPHGREQELDPDDAKAYGIAHSAIGPCL